MTIRRAARGLCFAVIGFAYVLSVPWYRDTDAPLRIWFGLPDWVTVALGCYVLVAIFNAVAWSLSDASDDDENMHASESIESGVGPEASR